MSKLKNQSGVIAHFLMILLLIAGLAAGLYLVQTGNLKLFSKASETVTGTDLIPTDLKAPSNAKAAHQLSVSWTVKNQGSREAVSVATSSAYEDRVYLSTRNTHDNDAFYLGKFTQTKKIASGESYTATVDVPLPNRPTGNYYLILKVDNWNDVPESNNGNNERVVQISLQANPVEGSGKAVFFDGNSSIKILDPNKTLAITRDFTIEAWIKPQRSDYIQTLIRRVSSNGPRYRIDIRTNADNKAELLFGNPVPTSGTYTDYVIPLDEWSHIAFVQKGNMLSAYINGQKVSEVAGTAPDLSEGDVSATMIGSRRDQFNQSDLGFYYKGGLDDLRISSIARNIEDNWKNGVYGKPLSGDQDILALWRFEGNLREDKNNLNTETVGNISYIDKPNIAPKPVPEPSFGEAAVFQANTFTDGSYIKPLQTHTIGRFNNATLEAWVNLEEKPGVNSYPIISKRLLGGASGDAFSYMLELTSQRKLKLTYSILYQNRWAPTEIVSNSAIEPNKWVHVAAVYNNVPLSEGQGTLRLFIDGKKDAQKYEQGYIGGGSETNFGDDVLIGTDPSMTMSFNGKIDEVRISSTPRYIGSTIAPSNPFTMNSDTLLLCHFDEQSGNPVCSSNSQATINTVSKNITYFPR